MTEEGGRNCIGLVFFKKGIKVPEQYIFQPPHTQVLQYFNRISTLTGANAIAAVNRNIVVRDRHNNEGHRVDHMAWMENPTTILQRADTNHDALKHDINEFGKLFEYYLQRPKIYYIMYLV